MPAYDYICAACGRTFEVTHGLHVPSPTSCPLCGKGPVRKAITAPAIHYRGSGWAKKERRATVTSGAKRSEGEGSSSGDSGSKESSASGASAPAKSPGGSGGADKN